MLFQGEEFAATAPFQYFADFSDDPDLARAVSEGRKKEFGQFGWKPDDVPDPGSPATFERSKLDWSELDDPEHRSILDWHHDLIRLRRDLPQLTDGRLDLICTESDEDESWLTVERGLVTIVANLSDQPRVVPLRERPTDRHPPCQRLYRRRPDRPDAEIARPRPHRRHPRTGRRGHRAGLVPDLDGSPEHLSRT